MNLRVDPFEWAGGHPGLDFVNTLDDRPSTSPVETLGTYQDLVRFAEMADIIDPQLAAKLLRFNTSRASEVVMRTRKLREHLFNILMSLHRDQPAKQADLEAVSLAIQAGHQARVLVKAAPPKLTEYCWRPLEADILLHACSLAVERLLAEVDRSKVRKCGASDCDVFYLDHSKGQKRLWCSMKGCGNREKQRRRRSGLAKE
ncbi:MAG: CGNR zinc finger domain-containing protein [Bradyrhizobium sp.]|uniref:CGNR zinc finger domain-containing protein n=1 Tax=Bradyrhizobium sp. TaxID=376 RepID=UPI001D2BC167|nr:ABATE domain-containing protein [Bradyrhizobium sp.]MBV9564817.1 CGNR zinc finger domain-containing protein [Bradyrhizobium sp.]